MPSWLDRWREAGGEIARQFQEGMSDAVAGTFDPRAGVIDPRGADFRNPPPQVEDPAIPIAERAARDAARAPYRAADAPVFTRIPTTGDAQLDDLAGVLRGLRADRVFGVYRVPDRFDERNGNERHAYLEWEIVHAPDATERSDLGVAFAGFGREDAWTRRAPGEPRVLDEDMAGVLVAAAGLDPADCYGLTRLWHVKVDGERHASAIVQGSLAVTRRDLAGAQRELAAQAPLAVGAPPFHVTVLDWEAVAAWVAPKRWFRPRTPSPLPHLPAGPQELLSAYLEIVGVQPEDCYGAQVTRTTDSGLGDLGPAGVSRTFTLPKSACADGTDRERLSAAEHVVIAYRDGPAYAEGRRRWAAYEDEVLHARLSHLTDVRPPLAVTANRTDPFLLEVAGMFNPLDPMHAFPQIFGRGDQPQVGPYCQRLVSAA